MTVGPHASQRATDFGGELVNPSISGIIASRKTNSYGSPSEAARSSSSRAAGPESTIVGTISQLMRNCSRIRQLVGLSSTTSAFTPRSSAARTALTERRSGLPGRNPP